ncbi:MAG: hypothetical protein ABJP34_04365 [Erythrobacter sp.]
MKRLLIVFPLAISMPAIPTPVAAQSAKPTVCEALAIDWDNIGKRLASNLSRGLTDNSAPRGTLRKLEDMEQWQKAEMVYAMMKDNKCSLPDSPPSAATYLTAATGCDLAKLRARSSDVPECDRRNWKKTGE